MEAIRKLSDSFWSDRNFSSFSSSWDTFDSDDISIFQRASNEFKITLIISCGRKNLNFFVILVKIDEKKLGTRLSKTHNSSSNSAIFRFQELPILNFLTFILFFELWNSHISIKLVRIRVSTSVSFSLDPVSSIFSVLGRINFFFFNLFSFLLTSTSSFFGFFFCFLFFSFFGGGCLLLSLGLSLFQLTLGNPFSGWFIKEFFSTISGLS